MAASDYKIRRHDRERPEEVLPDGTPVFARNAAGKRICNSPLRNKPGKRCQTPEPLLHSNGRCELHGGASPKGAEHPSFVTGKTSFYRDVLRPEHQAEFDRLMANGAYTSLQEDIAASRLRLRRAMLSFETVDPKALSELFACAEEAHAMLLGEYDEDDTESLLKRIVEAAEGVQKEIALGQIVERMQEQVRKLIDTENKRLMQEQDQIPAAKALALFFTLRMISTSHIRAFTSWLQENYPEAYNDPGRPKLLRLIAQEVAPLVPRRERSEIIDVEAEVTDLVPVTD